MANNAIEQAAQALAKCMDYPWEHMPEQGREAMRQHAVKVAAPLLAAERDRMVKLCREMTTEETTDAGTASRLSAELCPQKMAWEQRYSDDSGVQFAVRYDATRLSNDGDATIEIEAVDLVRIPANRLDWLIACLTKIRAETGHNAELTGASGAVAAKRPVE